MGVKTQDFSKWWDRGIPYPPLAKIFKNHLSLKFCPSPSISPTTYSGVPCHQSLSPSYAHFVILVFSLQIERKRNPPPPLPLSPSVEGGQSPLMEIQHLGNHKTCRDLADLTSNIVTFIMLKGIIEIDTYLEPSVNIYNIASLRK